MISLLLHSYLTNALLRIVTGQIFFLIIISKKCRKNGEKKKISKQLFYNIERDHRFNRHDTPFDFFVIFSFSSTQSQLFRIILILLRIIRYFFLSKQFSINIFRCILPYTHVHNSKETKTRYISLNNTRTTIHVECSVVTDLKILLL